jgi:predicted O-methyltransferase YrrM
MSNLLEQCPALREMLETRTALSANGKQIPIMSNLSAELAEALYQTVLKVRPAAAIEVGMAFGVSSLAILTALRDIGQSGKLITIDPHQSTDWANCGRCAVDRAGLSGWHELIEGFDYTVLPRLLESGCKIDFAYIDGWHTFDYALLDWWYVDKILRVDGVVGLRLSRGGKGDRLCIDAQKL